MLNRRILRVKAFKELYGSIFSEEKSLDSVLSSLELSCEATRDLYVYMLGIISPLTKTASQKIEAARSKFNPTPEEANPNMKFVENSLAKLLDNDPDFIKVFNKKKYSWEQYDIFLNNLITSIYKKQYFLDYMSTPERSLAEDCKLFIKIFEEEFEDNQDLEHILEDKSLYWSDDLPYALTWCCKTFKSLAKGESWSLLPLYQSDLLNGDDVESDKQFVTKLLRVAFSSYSEYEALIASTVVGWEKERLYTTDMALIILGLVEAATFPTIPIKVTINEYVEIAKYYGTQKSRSFVNGLLDKLIQAQVDSGKIVKSGRGLM